MQDVANAVFTHNLDTGGEAEKDRAFHCLSKDVPGYPFDFKKLFFLTHDDERAPAAAASGEGEKSVRALRWIDP